MSKHPRRSELQTRVEARIKQQFAQDKTYTFTRHDFNDIAKTFLDRRNLANDFTRRSNGYETPVQMYKVVGMVRGLGTKRCKVYAPLESPLPALEITGGRERKPKFERKFTEKDELILDREHRRENEQTPSPVLEVHNILFNLGVRK